jgi:hypothetical protein
LKGIGGIMEKKGVETLFDIKGKVALVTGANIPVDGGYWAN